MPQSTPYAATIAVRKDFPCKTPLHLDPHSKNHHLPLTPTNTNMTTAQALNRLQDLPAKNIAT